MTDTTEHRFLARLPFVPGAGFTDPSGQCRAGCLDGRPMRYGQLVQPVPPVVPQPSSVIGISSRRPLDRIRRC